MQLLARVSRHHVTISSPSFQCGVCTYHNYFDDHIIHIIIHACMIASHSAFAALREARIADHKVIEDGRLLFESPL